MKDINLAAGLLVFRLARLGLDWVRLSRRTLSRGGSCKARNWPKQPGELKNVDVNSLDGRDGRNGFSRTSPLLEI